MTSTDTPDQLRASAEQLIPLLYDDVRRLARHERRRFQPGETLQTTALVHEAYLKLMQSPAWNDRGHFLRAAALAMRQIITDMARGKLRHKRGSGEENLPLEAAEDVPACDWPGGGEDEIVALDEAMQKLGRVNPRLAEVVQCRYFAGYSEVEAAEALGMSERTLRREWVKARAWLYRELKSS